MTWKIPCLFLCLAVLLSGATAFGESRTIPYPEGIDPSLSGASSYGNIGDIADSPYFKHPDFYDMESTDTLTILPHFRTYQQSTEFTCGPGAVLMVLDYFGETGYDETEITEMAGCLSGQVSTPAGLLSFFEQIGWDAKNNLSDGKPNGEGEFTYETFPAWVQENLDAGTPIIVDWIDWSGHFQVVIGYDTMGTEHFGDDVLILADPYDTSDHLQDGYYIFNAERFFYMWREGFSADGDEIQEQPYVIARPKA